MTKLRLFLASTIALALTACNAETTGEAAPEGEAIAAIAAPAGSSWGQSVLRTEQGGWQVGNPDAPIKLIEYGSLTCPACAAFSVEGAAPLHAEYIESGRVSYELRSFMIHGVVDLLLTRLLECAPATAAVPLADQVWANLDAITGGVQANGAAVEAALQLPENQRFAAAAEAGGLTAFFAARGISADQSRQCLADSAAAEALAEKTQAAAEADEVTGTPTFFLNGARVDGTSWTVVEAALQRAGAR